MRSGYGTAAIKPARVVMHRIAEQNLTWGDLDNASLTHHGDAIRDIVNHREVVRNEKIGQIQVFLQVLEQVQNLRLDGNVER